MRRWVFAAALFLVAGCEPSPIERHRAVVAQVLEQNGSPDFEDASSDTKAAIRHAPSGLVCVLPRDGAFDFGVFPASAANAGAQCSNASGEVATAFIVVRYREPTNLDAAFSQALTETAGRAEAQPWTGEASAADRASPEGLPHFRIARFVARLGDREHFLRVAMSEVDGWYLQQIVSAPLGEAEAVEARAGQEWRAALAAFGVRSVEESE